MSTIKGTVRNSRKCLGAVLGFSGAVAFLGFLAVNWPAANKAESRSLPPASMASSSALSTPAPPATIDIVPTPLTSLNSGHFAGTGDGSEGSWIRP